MPDNPRSLPQMPSAVDGAMALSCTIPPHGRAERRTAVEAVLAKATSAREIDCGVRFSFDHTDEVAHELLDLVLAETVCCAQFVYTITFSPRDVRIDLGVDAAESNVRPLKDLYIGLAREAHVDVCSAN
jgi:hypothetical protein